MTDELPETIRVPVPLLRIPEPPATLKPGELPDSSDRMLSRKSYRIGRIGRIAFEKRVDIDSLQLAPPPPGIFEVGAAYDSFWGRRGDIWPSGLRTVFEAAWELSAMTPSGCMRSARTHKDSEDKLLKHLTDRVKKILPNEIGTPK